MADTALHFLLQAAAAAEPGLLVLDENLTAPLAPPPPGWTALSNRIDVAQQARKAGWHCPCNDFVFAAAPSLRRAAYRVSKEKRVVEHVLQNLWQQLLPGGELFLAGYKNEGIKTYASRAAEAWQTPFTLKRGAAGLHRYQYLRGTAPATTLNPLDYHTLQPIGDWQGAVLWSKPGIFAWDRLDAGSMLLLAQLPSVLPDHKLAELSALDLGCGNGLLALALIRAGCARVLATDNNAAAVSATQHNLALHAAASQFHTSLDDCAENLQEKVDLVLCNPPFHQGFTVAGSLTERFLHAARRLLKPGGRALFVVNSFIPLERKAALLFPTIRTLSDDRHFKVVALETL